MGFFRKLGRLFDQLVDWLGKALKNFIERLINALEKIWETVVVTALIAAYGFVAGLYVIFYTSKVIGETIMEIWDPNYYDSKPPQVFGIGEAPKDAQLPPSRENAKIMKLETAS